MKWEPCNNHNDRGYHLLSWDLTKLFKKHCPISFPHTPHSVCIFYGKILLFVPIIFFTAPTCSQAPLYCFYINHFYANYYTQTAAQVHTHTHICVHICAYSTWDTVHLWASLLLGFYDSWTDGKLLRGCKHRALSLFLFHVTVQGKCIQTHKYRHAFKK